MVIILEFSHAIACLVSHTCKPTHTDKYLSYNSHHPVSHKKSVAKTLLQRAEHLPSNSDSQANEREYVLNILRENNYPKDFLKNCLNPSACRNQNNSEGDTSIKGYAVVPYIQGVTEPIKRILSNCNIKVALKPYLTLGHIFANEQTLYLCEKNMVKML